MNQSGRMERVREALFYTPPEAEAYAAAALAEVEETETRLARLENDTHLLARDNAIRLDRLRAAEAEADRLKAALERVIPKSCFHIFRAGGEVPDRGDCPRCIALRALAPPDRNTT